MPNPHQVVKVHLTATGPAGETFAVATYANGRCGVTRDGTPIDGMEWPLDQYDQCAAALARLAGLGK